MEHPFLVEEFTPAHATHIGFASANRLVTAEPQPPAALPPLPNLSASEVLFLAATWLPPTFAPSSVRRSARCARQNMPSLS